eukprot:scaffold283257_cov41-Prasinocladus_malaysianus.AAC.1
MSHDEAFKLGFPGAEDLANMFKFKCNVNGKYYNQVRNPEASRLLAPKALSFEAWLRQNKDAMLKMLESK